MEIPRDSAIAMSTTHQREQNKAEQERLKRLVLNYEEREEELDKQCEPFTETGAQAYHALTLDCDLQR